jgi:tRNA (cytidine/uridine-2'-O-)-methyltransferase
MTICIALYQPDIPGNTGTILRMAACFDLEVHIIEPAGFDLSDRALQRAGMDYLEMAAVRRHIKWERFLAWCAAHKRRIVLHSTKADIAYTDFSYDSGDMLLFGRESGGVPDEVHKRADARLLIPMRPERRSLNIALAAAMAAGEAMRQTGIALP